MIHWLSNALLFAQSPDAVTGMFSGLDPDKKFALVTVVVGCATGVICTIVMFVSSTINSVHRRRLEADMKREMIERGMTAQEIATIIEAASPPEDGTQRWIASWARPKRS
jgi:hypothetical protein